MKTDTSQLRVGRLGIIYGLKEALSQTSPSKLFPPNDIPISRKMWNAGSQTWCKVSYMYDPKSKLYDIFGLIFRAFGVPEVSLSKIEYPILSIALSTTYPFRQIVSDMISQLEQAEIEASRNLEHKRMYPLYVIISAINDSLTLTLYEKEEYLYEIFLKYFNITLEFKD